MRLLVFLSLLLVLAGGASSYAAKTQGLTLERVVIVMRHGVRPPTKDPAMAPGFAKDAWPKWPVPPGHLTPHGAEGVRKLAAYERLREGRLFGTGCPAAGEVRIVADTDQRTIKTGEAFAEAFAPGCNLATQHKPEGETDVLFSPLGPEVNTAFDAAAARRAVLAGLGKGGLAGAAKDHAAALAVLQKVYGCCSAPLCESYRVKAPCGLADLPTTLVEGEGKPKMSGALDLGSTAAQILLLQYVEGKPMSEVGWGRASKKDIEKALALHPLEYRLVARTPYVSTRGAKPLLDAVAEGLKPSAPKLTVLVGHDTNIAHIGGALNLAWKAGDYPANDPPPGGMLGFEVVRDGKGARFVRAFFQAQTMDQLRNLTTFSAARPPFRQAVAIPGCARWAKNGLCPLDRFEALASAPPVN